MAALCYTVPPAADGVRLGVFLRAQGVSASGVKAVKHQGEGFFADGRPLHTDQPVRAGQRITFALPPEPPTAVQPQPVPFSLLTPWTGVRLPVNAFTGGVAALRGLPGVILMLLRSCFLERAVYYFAEKSPHPLCRGAGICCKETTGP